VKIESELVGPFKLVTVPVIVTVYAPASVGVVHDITKVVELKVMNE